jgi:hypothetical protein
LFDNNGYENDNWPGITKWNENNATVQNFHGMVIHEPCNYASNMAYYHMTTEFCKTGAAGFSMSKPHHQAIAQAS